MYCYEQVEQAEVTRCRRPRKLPQKYKDFASLDNVELDTHHGRKLEVGRNHARPEKASGVEPSRGEVGRKSGQPTKLSEVPESLDNKKSEIFSL